MLGIYENFPENYHGIIRFRHQAPARRLQGIILQSLQKLGQEGDPVFSTLPSVSNCKVDLDFGVADGRIFDYLSEETLDASLKTVSKDALPMLDFICIVRYYKRDAEVYRPLKFDYLLLRFAFYGGSVDFQIFHERGTRRLSIEDVSTIIISKIDKGLVENGLPEVTVEYARTL